MAISHRTNRLKLISQPSVEQLQNGRFRITLQCRPLNPRNDWYEDNKDRIFLDYGSLYSDTGFPVVDGIDNRDGEAYPNMRLVSTRSQGANDDYVIELIYETLSDTFVQVKDDTVDYELNGLRRVTRESIAEAGTDFQKTVGTTSISSQIDGETAVTCILASYQVDDTDSYRSVKETYIEAGTISESVVNGPSGLPNTFTRTINSFITEPTSDGVLLSKETTNTNGFEQYQYRFLERHDGSSPVDTDGTSPLLDYEKNIQVRAPGIISASTRAVTGGTIAVLNSTPPSIKSVQADVKISLVTTNTVSAPVAYNLSGVSCSATITNITTSPVGVESGGGLTVSVYNTNTQEQTRNFPNHYFTGSNVNSEISSPAQIIRDRDNIIGETLNSTVETDIVLSGSSSAPATTGIYQEDIDPVFMTYDEDSDTMTQYYRKTTYTIPAP